MYVICSTVVIFDIVVLFSGARTTIHPKVTIIAEAGPIIIGENNLIEEQTTIINRYVVHMSARCNGRIEGHLGVGVF